MQGCSYQRQQEIVLMRVSYLGACTKSYSVNKKRYQTRLVLTSACTTGTKWLMKFVCTVWDHVQKEWATWNRSRFGEDPQAQT
mmetsp:Transcript_7964/g.12630  ORF Transcript_7964/g.12630 Transcript_7964/m.12630 type:complete len:83 (-) Transcript_7964:177-425(-)